MLDSVFQQKEEIGGTLVYLKFLKSIFSSRVKENRSLRRPERQCPRWQPRHNVIKIVPRPSYSAPGKADTQLIVRHFPAEPLAGVCPFEEVQGTGGAAPRGNAVRLYRLCGEAHVSYLIS